MRQSDPHTHLKSKEIISAVAPQEVRVSKSKGVMTLRWDDGSETNLSAQCLRENCKSATSEKLRLTNLAVPPSSDLTIETIKPIGSYGLNIVFSDGFDRGIYPWSYLRDIGVQETIA